MFFRTNWLTLVWAAFILILMLLPGKHIPHIEDTFVLSPDKLAHIFVFLVLAYLMVRGFSRQHQYSWLKIKALPISLIISVSYSLTLEGFQYFSEQRTVDVYDALANLIGCLLGCAIYQLLIRWQAFR